MITHETVATPLSLKGLLDQSMKQMRRHVVRIYPSVAVPLAAASALVPLVQMQPRAQPDVGSVMAVLVATLLVMVVWSAVYMVMLAAATDALSGREVSMGRAWGLALDPRAVGTQMVSGLACLLGAMCCIVPGIYLGLLLSLGFPVIASERIFGWGAMRRSASLMRFNPRQQWGSDPRVRAFLLYFAAGLISYSVSMLVQLPLVALTMVIAFREAMSGGQADVQALTRKLMWIQVPANVIGSLVTTLVLLYLAFGTVLLYIDIVRRKEGDDLIAAADRLASSGVFRSQPSSRFPTT